jgi:hypothetical protein
MDPTRDLSDDRQIILDNGNKYHVAKSPACAYGYWYIHMDKGTIPNELKGKFLTPKDAYAAIGLYVASCGKRKIVEIVEK